MQVWGGEEGKSNNTRYPAQPGTCGLPGTCDDVADDDAAAYHRVYGGDAKSREAHQTASLSCRAFVQAGPQPTSIPERVCLVVRTT